MDPLSVIASSIAIATPIALGLKKLKAIHHAKPELLRLFNEISEVILLLQELDQTLRHHEQLIYTSPDPGLLQILDAILQKLQKLERQISEWNNTTSQQPHAPIPWPKRWTAISSKVIRFKDELGIIRSQLMCILSMINMSVAPRVYLRCYLNAYVQEDPVMPALN